MLRSNSKINDKAVPLSTHCIMRMYWGMAVHLKAFLISALHGGNQSHAPATLSHIYIRYQAGQAPEVVLTLRNIDKHLPLK